VWVGIVKIKVWDRICSVYYSLVKILDSWLNSNVFSLHDGPLDERAPQMDWIAGCRREISG
jgi:hypothetical protein